nr:hypothetical protein [Tanacetum cinerariifolium]
MHGMGKTVNELLAMLKLHEDTLPKKDANPALHAIQAGRVQKNQKNKPHKTVKRVMVKAKERWAMHLTMRHFLPNLRLLRHVRKIILKRTPFVTNVVKLGTREGTVSCLRGSRKLKPGALSLYVGEGQRSAIEAIGTYHLELPSGLVIVLNNCHYAPSITRGVISVSRLFDDGFNNHFDENNVISVSKNNLVYFMAVPRDSIFEIDMSCSNTNDSSMYAISNKRAKINLDLSLLWHCRLGHISKKRIKKLQNDGFLNSIDIESIGKYVSCMFGKMARKPYSHQVERAIDLLRLICTDVCGPIRIVLRQGANYFFIFTDDFSRYGYVYLLKHKHEVFETFKAFQKEVENQLGKTIKSLRSDRGSEYMSQEFLDHLKEQRIIAHRTRPYTSHNNGVSERRNQTLLDMVDKTPYKIWHGKAPKLSYLKVQGCEALVKHDTLTKPDKLDPRSFRCIFIGYPKETIGYSFYSPSENKEEDTNPSSDTSLDHEEDDQEINEPQRDLGEPANYKAALLDLESKKCLNALNVEMQSMKDNDVWVLVKLPPNARTVGSNEPANYKAALLDLESKKCLNALNVEMQSMKDNDVWVLVKLPPNARTVEVYMEQPEGFVNPKYPNHVCKLKHSIYGLKQASRQWNKQFDDEIKKFGFTQNPDEPCVYQKASGSYVAILILYVDDILLMGNNIPMLQDVKSNLRRSFAMKDLGDDAYILGIKIYRDRLKRLIGLCQSTYIENILKRYYMENSKRGTIPMQEKLKLSKSQGASTPTEKQRRQNVPYASAIGSIMYFVRCTRPDVAFAQNITNAEYIVAIDASKEAVWIRKFISGLGIVPTIEEPISMYCDNTRAISIAKDDGVTKGARHFYVKVYYLRETIKLGDVNIEKVDTDDNLADPFTKTLAFPKHSELTRNIGMFPASSFM